MPDGNFHKVRRLFKQLLLRLMTKEQRRRYQADGDERENLHQELSSEMWEIFRERQEHNDLRLIRKGRRYNLPIPPRCEEYGFWEEWGPGNWVLQRKALIILSRKFEANRRSDLRCVKLGLMLRSVGYLLSQVLSEH